MSDELVIDLSNYKDRVGTRVIPARYRVQVEDAESTESSNHNPMVNLWFKVIGGEFDGATITDRLVLTEKSLFRVVGFMQAIGLPTPKRKLKVNIRQFVGRVLDIEVDDGEPYNGRIRSEVRAYYKVPKGEGTDQSDDAIGEDDSVPDTAEEAVVAADPAEMVAAGEASDQPAEALADVDLDAVEL
jgi:hypothetical protein